MANESTNQKTLGIKRLLVKIQFNEVLKVVDEIADSFPYAIIKGIPLSLMAYNDCYKRNIGDVDILINKENIGPFDEILRNNGFKCNYRNREEKLIALLYSHQTRPFLKDTPLYKTYVDVNYDIFWGEYTGKRVGIGSFLSDACEINIEGMSFRTLPPLKMLIAIILHHYKETNSIYHLYTHNTIRKDMFYDVYKLIINNPDSITVKNLCDACIQYGISAYAYYILYYTYFLFPDPILLQFVKELYSEEGKALLDCFGLDEKERKRWKCDFLTRVNETDLKTLIMNQLTPTDLEKIERNKMIFGE